MSVTITLEELRNLINSKPSYSHEKYIHNKEKYKLADYKYRGKLMFYKHEEQFIENGVSYEDFMRARRINYIYLKISKN